MLFSVNRLAQLLGVPRTALETIAAHAGGLYTPFDLRKPGSNKWRHIDNPNNDIKLIQQRIQRRLLRAIEFPDTVVGGVVGRSLTDNIAFHVGQPLVITMDLRQCFPRTTHKSVFNALRRELEYSTEVAGLLTQLTTRHGHVPQGAPTSLSLVNLTLRPLHRELTILALDLRLRFSMWVDDITFSGARAREAITPTATAARRYGHSINPAKTIVMPASTRQIVTGFLANARPSLGRLRRSKLRRQILEVADNPEPPSNLLQSIWGRIRFVEHICPAQGASLRALATRLLPDDGGPPERRPRSEAIPCSDTTACRARTYRTRAPLQKRELSPGSAP